MDSLHFYLYHLFDTGLRVHKTQIEADDQDEKIENEDDIDFDVEFSRTVKAINALRSICDSFQRFQSTQKFSINTNKNEGTFP